MSEPHKAKKGWFGGVVYTIITKYYGDEFSDYGSNSHFSVTRSYKDIKTLYQYLLFTYIKQARWLKSAIVLKIVPSIETHISWKHV